MTAFSMGDKLELIQKSLQRQKPYHGRVVFLCLMVLLCTLVPSPASAQTPVPPPPEPIPTPVVICPVEFMDFCLVPIQLGSGWPAWLLLFVLIILFAAAWLFAGDLRAWLRSQFAKWRWRRTRTSADITGSDGPADLLLTRRLVPLSVEEQAVFVELESGLLDLNPPLTLELLSQSGQPGQGLREADTFRDLHEAMTKVDPSTNQPYKAFVLLGEPGAGKTWLLRKLARDLSQSDNQVNGKKYTPFLVSLGGHKQGTPVEYLRTQWRDVSRIDDFDNRMNEGGLLLLADGLNEMPRVGYDARLSLWREFLRENFLSCGNHAIIACRETDYSRAQLDQPRLTVHPMDDTRIKEFLQKRSPVYADSLWDQLEKDREDGRGDVFRLATIPFWLDLIAEVSRSGSLPTNRGHLAKKFVISRLDRDYAQKGDNRLVGEGRQSFTRALTEFAWQGLAIAPNHPFPRHEAEQVLEKEGSSTWVSIDDLVHAAVSCGLLEHSPVENTIYFHHQLFQEYFAACRLCEVFTSGRGLPRSLHRHRLYRLWKIPWRKWQFKPDPRILQPLPGLPTTGWEEAVVISSGLMNRSSMEELVAAISKHNPTLAARCLVESGSDPTPELENLVRELLQAQIANPRRRLPARLAAGDSLGDIGDPRVLNGEGVTLLLDGHQVNFISPDWVPVPEGIFFMGCGERDDRRLKRYNLKAYADEKPGHTVWLSDFQIGRYPVTVAEYRCFWKAEGYQQERYWEGEAALRWLRGEIQFEDSFQARLYKIGQEQRVEFEDIAKQMVATGTWPEQYARATLAFFDKPREKVEEEWRKWEDERRDESGRVQSPWRWDNPQYTNPSQPVVGVCWYEASAYTSWLTETLQSEDLLQEDEQVRLPSEAEWEKAARGRDGRLWPWGNRWDNRNCNSIEGCVLKPSPVGAYPQGASPNRVMDMAGNVWEWCADWFDPEIYKKRSGETPTDPVVLEQGTLQVVRGGSWFNFRNDARCAYRSRIGPDSFYNSLGFRLVRSHIVF